MSDIFKKQTEQFFSISKWEQMNPQLTVGFTTKNGGVSVDDYASLNIGFHVNDQSEHVVQNRAIIAEKIQFPLNQWVSAEQTHKTNICHVTKQQRGLGAKDYNSALKDTDGMYTNEDGVLLTMCYADCVPIYYFAPERHYIGVVHAGWKGTVAGIASEMVLKWKQEGIQPHEIYSVIGPSICRNCYIVDDKVIKEVHKMVEDVNKKPYNLISEGQYSLDLKELNKQILWSAGVRNIDVTNFCTSCGDQEFFSYRRDGGKTGRLMSFIGWKEDSL